MARDGSSELPPTRCATLKLMAEVGIRALKQNASAVVADATAGETVTITDRGRPVAQLTAIPASRLQQLIASGSARPAKRDIGALPRPEPGPALVAELVGMRISDRY
jgi:prevent-host-death family protein